MSISQAEFDYILNESAYAMSMRYAIKYHDHHKVRQFTEGVVSEKRRQDEVEALTGDFESLALELDTMNAQLSEKPVHKQRMTQLDVETKQAQSLIAAVAKAKKEYEKEPADRVVTLDLLEEIIKSELKPVN